MTFVSGLAMWEEWCYKATLQVKFCMCKPYKHHIVRIALNTVIYGRHFSIVRIDLKKEVCETCLTEKTVKWLVLDCFLQLAAYQSIAVFWSSSCPHHPLIAWCHRFLPIRANPSPPDRLHYLKPPLPSPFLGLLLLAGSVWNSQACSDSHIWALRSWG